MFDVVTFGSATKDIFVSVDDGVVLKKDNFASGKGICFSLGSKIKAKEIYFTSGGGGTNTAATFAKQKMKVAYCGKVGDDSVGNAIVKNLRDIGVNIDFVSYTREKPTNHSIIIDTPGLDRTILTYRGASDLHSVNDIYFDELNSKWFYLAPLPVNDNNLFYHICKFAYFSDIKILINPSKNQINDKKSREIIEKANILLLNVEEASILAQLPYKEEREIFKKISSFENNIVLITRGKKGVVAYSKGTYYEGKPIYPDSIDKTGAGDSFGAGFLSEYIRSEDIEKSLQFGIANSTSCLQKKGAKNGLLAQNENYEKAKINKNSKIEMINF